MRDIAYGGDAYPCVEIAWSPDGSKVAILRPNATATIVDIVAALQQTRDARLWHRDVSLTWPQGRARAVRFVDVQTLEFDACDRDQMGASGCLIPYERRRLDISTTPARGVAIPAAISGDEG